MYSNYNDQINYIGQTTINNVPSKNWAKIELVAHLIADGEGCCLESHYWEKGKTEAIAFDPDDEEEIGGDYEILNIFDDMRYEMYQEEPEKGAWFIAAMTITPDEMVEVEYDYEIKPNLEIEPEDEDFVLEYEYFPRKRKYMPDWWLEILERNNIEVKD